jgi:Tfp pilus assembly protein PilX
MTQHDQTQPSEPAATLPPAPRDVERGSALIVAMMIMVILTMLGVTFAVLAAQEEKISVNARDHEQTLYAAESALEIARTWFNDPSNSTNLFKPTSAQMNYSLRKGAMFTNTYKNADERAAGENDTFSQVDGSAGNVYTGGNMGGGSSRFDKPYRGTAGNTLWGRPATPDVLLCGDLTLDVNADGTVDCTATMKQYMDKLNTSLLMGTNLRNAGHSSRDSGTVQVEQIRVYRPPVDFDMNTRYGIATIEATAVKRAGNQIVARRTVREVLQEIPFPGPSGAIETEGEISDSGSSGSIEW